MKKIISFACILATLVACHRTEPDNPDKPDIEIPDTPETPDTPDNPPTIELILTDISYNCVSGIVTPSDPEMRWILFHDDRQSVDAFASSEDLIADDLAYFKDLSEQRNVPLSTILEENSHSGSFEGLITDGLAPESEYSIWVYGIDLEGKVLTDLVRVDFTTTSFKLDDISFNIDAQVEGNTINVAINPSYSDAAYYFDLMLKSKFETYSSSAEAVQSSIDGTMAYYGLSGKDFVENFCCSGPMVYAFEDLFSDTEYVIFACAVDPQSARIGSEVTIKQLRTDKAASSENAVSINIDQITPSSVILSSNTTNDDPYYLNVEKASTYAGMSEEQIMSTIVAQYGYNISFFLFNGSQEMLEFSNLVPETEYCIIAFGYGQGGANTGLVRIDFATTSAGNPAECNFEFSVTGIRSDRATLICMPSNPNTGYIFDLLPEGGSTEAFKGAISAKVREGVAAGANEMEMWHYLCSRGDMLRQIKDLTPNSSYTPVAVAIDEISGGFAGDVVLGESFKTLAEGEVPDGDVSLEIRLALPSELMSDPDIQAQFPDTSCLGFVISGDNISSGTYAFRKSSEIEGYTDDQLDMLMFWADALSTVKLSYIEKDGYYSDVFTNLDPDTSYTFIVQAKDAKGGTIRRIATATTASQN